MKTHNREIAAFVVGFTLAAIPITYWLIGLPIGNNGPNVLLAVTAEFSSGFGCRAIYRRLANKKAD